MKRKSNGEFTIALFIFNAAIRNFSHKKSSKAIDNVTMLRYNANVTMLRKENRHLTEQELISKKELLELYDISYGALYRWKRKGLIPEDWFIKKSTVTGQETFFPKKLICERMELIKKQKDDISLEELSKLFSKESKKNASIIIETVFGNKTFYLNEIKAIIIDNGDGTKKDITNDILGGNK